MEWLPLLRCGPCLFPHPYPLFRPSNALDEDFVLLLPASVVQKRGVPMS